MENKEIKMKSEKELYKRALDTWGRDAQLWLVVEEMGELTQAISKLKRGSINELDLAREIADVEIMLEQLKYIFDLRVFVRQARESKLIRLQMRLEKRGEESGNR